MLGSGPSVSLFQRKEDVVIGVNGAASLLKPKDYLLSGDERAHLRDWFKRLPKGVVPILKPHSAMYCETFYPNQALRERLIRIYVGYMDSHPERVHVADDGFRSVYAGDPVMDGFFAGFPLPAPPNAIVRKVSFDCPVGRDSDRLVTGATSAAMAMHLAVVMGASEIHLYGVQFTNEASGKPTAFNGTNYFYVPKPGEAGRTTANQMERMDVAVMQASQAGVPVYSHGFTRLQNTIEIDANEFAPLAEPPAPSQV